MSRPKELRQLFTLERLRSLELETAQADHVKLERVTVEKQAAVERVRADIADAQGLARDLVAEGNMLSPQVLQGFARFVALKGSELETAKTEWEQARTDSDAAHEVVVERFTDLRTVEKLRQRRETEAERESMRGAQKQLDEHALSRLGPVTGGSESSISED